MSKVAAAVGSPDPQCRRCPCGSVAYVELKQEAVITEDEILDTCGRGWGERAAVPKQIFIYPSDTFTPVGKIFKPALRRESIRKVYLQDFPLYRG